VEKIIRVLELITPSPPTFSKGIGNYKISFFFSSILQAGKNIIKKKL
jgi:hypothetical protein